MNRYARSADEIVGMRVRVQRNFRDGTLSIKCMSTNKVVWHADHVQLANAFFTTNDRLRQEELRGRGTKQWAWAEGIFLSAERINRGNPVFDNLQEAILNAHKYETFIDKKSLAPVRRAPYAYIRHNYGRFMYDWFYLPA